MERNSAPPVPANPVDTTTTVEQDWPLLMSLFSGQVYTKSLTAGTGNPVVSILTYPTQDYAGDRVRPDGGDWSRYPDHPYVNWTHGVPIGRGTVNHRILKFEGKTTPVAVGQTTFLYTKADVDGLDLRRRDPRTKRFWDKQAPYTVDDVLEASAQAERLIRDDIANGVSIEFDVDVRRKGQDFWDLGTPSLLENRPARHFEVWKGLGYAHARTQVNPGCMTVAGQPRSDAGSPRSDASSPRSRFTPKTEAVEKAIRIAQTGKLPGGELVCKAIMESFLDLKNYRSPAVSVLVEGTPPTTTTAPPQAIPAAATTPITVKATDTQEGVTSSGGKKMGAGHQTGMNIAQGLMDLCTQAEDNGSDDPALRRFFKKMCGKLKDLAGDVKARIEKHKSKLDSDEDDGEDPMDEDDYDPSTEEKAIEVNDDGVIITKAFPDWKPRRATFANLVPVEPAPVVPTEPEPKVVVKARKKAIRQLNESLTGLSQILEAAQANGRL